MKNQELGSEKLEVKTKNIQQRINGEEGRTLKKKHQSLLLVCQWLDGMVAGGTLQAEEDQVGIGHVSGFCDKHMTVATARKLPR